MFRFIKNFFDKIYPPVKKGKQYLCTRYYVDDNVILSKDDIYTSNNDNYITNLFGVDAYVTPMMRRVLEEYHTKFQVGDWVIDNKRKHKPLLITGMSLYFYYMHNSKNILASDIESDWMLWDVTYAKTGDILACNSFQFIFKDIDGDKVNYFCGIDNDNKMVKAGSISLKDSCITPVNPSNKHNMISVLYDNGYVFKNNNLVKISELDIALNTLLHKAYKKLNKMPCNKTMINCAIIQLMNKNRDIILNAARQDELNK